MRHIARFLPLFPIAVTVVLVAGCAPAPATVTPPDAGAPASAADATSAPAAGGAATTGADAATVAATELGADAVETATGLFYADTKVGDGVEATTCTLAAVHYTGRLADGTVFDSSLDRGKPLLFTVGTQPPQVIAGWNEGVTGMKVGGQRRLVIPAALGYGAEGVPGTIPGGAVLVFDVELVDANPKDALPEAPASVEAYEKSDTGLEYAVLEPGDGAAAKAGDRVHVHYAGWLTDGTMFDSSLKADRCEPLPFIVGAGNVIPGWDEGVTGMQVGERRQLRIPADLAYGASGQGDIPPDSTLVFDVTLVGIE